MHVQRKNGTSKRTAGELQQVLRAEWTEEIKCHTKKKQKIKEVGGSKGVN